MCACVCVCVCVCVCMCVCNGLHTHTSRGNMGPLSKFKGVVKTNLEKKFVAVVGILIQIVNKIVSQN